MIVREIELNHVCSQRLYVEDQRKGVFPPGAALPACTARARYDVDGVKMCRRHAALYVLDELISNRREGR